ncbi:MAG: Holliday junction branch migration protein RuvA [Clostridia bacterium]|nr:Holliday junction branch migration protein RuvA [Clostridia bacterium]
MISSLNGKLIYSCPDYIVIECGGVGFKCFITKSAAYKLPPVGQEIFVHTYLVVKEDAMDLYGFSTREELETFKLITSVNGVGAKIGMALLAQFTPESLLLYIAGEDAKMLTAASGVGLKLAQRIVLELKDKTGNISTANSLDISAVSTALDKQNTKEAVAALVSLGFSQSEASQAVSKLDKNLSAEELIKNALKQLSRQV